MKYEEFLEMFDIPIFEAYIQYYKNREEKGDSWNDENITSLKFLKKKLKEEVKEYFKAKPFEKTKELADVINMALMLYLREYSIITKKIGDF